MNILIGCEESQAVCIEMRKNGHNAFSCDLQKCSGGHPEWHLNIDIFSAINGGLMPTESGELVLIKKWDLLIAHPTCTYLANSGVCWLYNKDGSRNIERWNNMQQGAIFFNKILSSNIEKIAVENPVPHKYALEIIGKKYTQIIQPYQFGHAESKATCFWLKGLPKLKATNDVKEQWKQLPKNEAQRLHYLPPGPERAKLRSKTFQGVAAAFADQWGSL